MVTRVQARPSTPVAVLVPVVATVLCAAALVVASPMWMVIVLVALGLLTAMMLRIEWAVLVYVAVEPFGDYVALANGSAVKLVGAVLFAAWLLRLALDSRPIAIRHPAVFAAGGLFLALVASAALHSNGSAGLEVTSRYLSYLGVLVVLVDTMRNGLAPRRVAGTFVISSSLAAVAGLVVFINSEGGRAGGPVEDPNDFAFYLICAIPFAVYLWSDATGIRRHLLAGSIGVLLVATAATFSRGAMLGIVAMVAVAAVLGLVRLRAVMVGAGVLVAAIMVISVASPDVVNRSIHEKQTVASANVSSRYASWTMAAEMTADSPVLGKGPAGFRTNFKEFAGDKAVDQTHLDVAHQMLLDVSSELGLVGLAAFGAMLVYGVTGALRGARQGRSPAFAQATVVSFAGILVAAMFLSEQYYLPIWLLVAFGAVVDPRSRERV